MHAAGKTNQQLRQSPPQTTTIYRRPAAQLWNSVKICSPELQPSQFKKTIKNFFAPRHRNYVNRTEDMCFSKSRLAAHQCIGRSLLQFWQWLIQTGGVTNSFNASCFLVGEYERKSRQENPTTDFTQSNLFEQVVPIFHYKKSLQITYNHPARPGVPLSSIHCI